MPKVVVQHIMDPTKKILRREITCGPCALTIHKSDYMRVWECVRYCRIWALVIRREMVLFSLWSCWSFWTELMISSDRYIYIDWCITKCGDRLYILWSFEIWFSSQLPFTRPRGIYDGFTVDIASSFTIYSLSLFLRIIEVITRFFNKHIFASCHSPLNQHQHQVIIVANNKASREFVHRTFVVRTVIM